MKRMQWIAQRLNFAASTGFFAIALATLSLNLTPSVSLSQTTVALVDMAQVFEGHPTFKQQLQALKLDADTLQNTVLQQRDQITAEAESASLIFKPGTPEFKDKEKELAMKLAQLDVNSKTAMRDLMAREARLHYDVYREINQLIESFCRTNQVRLVLRYNRPNIDRQDPESIMQLINSMVVYHQPNQDITALIVGSLRQVGTQQSQLPSEIKQ